MKRSTQILVALVGILLTGFAVPSIASAEQCSPDGKICLVTDTSQALLSPVTLEFKVTSEANYFDISPSARNQQLVGPGLEGFNIWTVGMSPAASEGLNIVEAYASGPGLTSPVTSQFSVPVLAPAINYKTTIRRTKQRVYAFYEFDARTTITATVRLHLNSFDSDDIILDYREVTRTVSPEPGQALTHYVLRVAFSRNHINRLCRSHGACSVLASGEAEVGDLKIDDSSDRKKLKTHRTVKPKKPTTKSQS